MSMKRKTRWVKDKFVKGIRPITKDSYPKKFITFDCETNINDNNSFKMGSVYGETFYKIFWNKDEMAKFLLSKRFNGYIRYATNLDFDLSCLYQPFIDEWLLLISNGKLIFGSFNDKTPFKKFHDTLNLTYNMSVKKMGDILGIPKGNIDFETCSDKELEKYNLNDSRITYLFMKWFNDYIFQLGGEVKVTLASTSLYLFRKKYLKEFYKKPDRVHNKLHRRAYYGGRVEVFQEGVINNDFYIYDINSQYPYAMMITPLPNPNYMKWKKFGNYDDIINFEGVTACTVQAPNKMNIPILPLKFKADNWNSEKLIFPLGEFKGVWTNNELRYAISNGYEILNIDYAYIFEKTMNELFDYVNELYSLRLKFKAKNDKREIILKILLNSLYGKFGINPSKNYSGELTHIDNIKNFEMAKGWYQYGETLYFFRANNFKPNYEIPIWSAYITATARKILHQFLSNCSQVYYCDTDSIFTPDVLLSSNEIGKLKNERSCKWGEFLIPKGYRVIDSDDKEIYKFKGVPHCDNFKHDEKCNHTIKDFWSNNFNTELKRLIKIKTGLKMNRLINSQYLITKHSTLKNEKRIYDDKGNSKPLEIYNEEIVNLG